MQILSNLRNFFAAAFFLDLTQRSQRSPSFCHVERSRLPRRSETKAGDISLCFRRRQSHERFLDSTLVQSIRSIVKLNLPFLRTLCVLCANLMLALLLFAGFALAADSPEDALRSLVEAEKNFAQMASEKGIRDAFLANLADDAVLFDPGPVNGKELYRKRPPSDARLTWQPIFADVARAGDIGYTTGPWEFKKKSSDEKPAAYGQFFTIWKKQADGKWKIAIDAGIDTPASTEKPSDSTNESSGLSSNNTIDLKTARLALDAAEKEFDQACAKDAGTALIAVADPNIRVFRNGRFPAMGRDAAQIMIGYDHGKMTMKHLGGGVSRSADLAYSYGEYSTERLDGVERGVFVTIWKMSLGGDWRVVADIRKSESAPEKKAGE
jgi:ketosteroid isomerase-like protein